MVLEKIFEGFFFFFFFFIISLWELMSPGAMVSLDPRGTVGRIYKSNLLTLLTTKYLSSGPHGFREEYFFKFFPLYI